MRKVMLSLLGCFTGLAAQAQVTKLPEGFTSGKTVWMVRAGVSLSTVTGDGVDATKNNWNKNKWSGTDTSVDISDFDGYTNYDFGVIGGIGSWYGHFNIDMNYQRGFISMLDSDNSFFCNKLQVRLGYAF